MKPCKRPPLVFPVLITLLITAVILLTRLDCFFADLFYTQASNSWFFKNTMVEKLIYDLSPVPAFILFGIAVLVLVGSIWKADLRRLRRGSIYWILVMVLGPGLVVNAVFKDYYGRPRPKQTELYGGKMEFCPVWVPGESGKGKSFPCGHASVGFYFMAGYFFWWRSNRRLARIWMGVGLAAGGLIGLARMAVGAHWFSDVVWAGLFVYLICYATAWGCGLLNCSTEEPS